MFVEWRQPNFYPSCNGIIFCNRSLYMQSFIVYKSQPRWLSGLRRSRVHSLWLLVDHCVLRNWDRILVRAVKGLISRAGMVSICPLLWQRDVKLQQTNKPSLFMDFNWVVHDDLCGQPRWLSGLMRSRVHSLWLLVDHCVLRNWNRVLVRAVKWLISRAGMVSICPLLWQRDVKLQQTNDDLCGIFFPTF